MKGLGTSYSQVLATQQQGIPRNTSITSAQKSFRKSDGNLDVFSTVPDDVWFLPMLPEEWQLGTEFD